LPIGGYATDRVCNKMQNKEYHTVSTDSKSLNFSLFPFNLKKR